MHSLGMINELGEIRAQTSLRGQIRESELERAKKLLGWDSTVAEEPVACRAMRLKELDSSISVRIGCKSSVAETTGNSSMRTQIKSRHARRRL
ncbi:hypothetical protein SBA7_300064 [Candidatus Sulfotelmatobacter sp. SbA7]|nr:hypothetical protein SBA7_300064 [Candidatus Sulfotelmatobacter sp. SbA7]